MVCALGSMALTWPSKYSSPGCFFSSFFSPARTAGTKVTATAARLTATRLRTTFLRIVDLLFVLVSGLFNYQMLDASAIETFKIFLPTCERLPNRLESAYDHRNG